MPFLRCVAFAILLLPCAFSAEKESNVDVYTAPDLQAMAQSLQVRSGTYADKDLARYDNHYLLLIKREDSGSSELHEHEADIFFVQSGEATILTGGKMLGGHTTKPGEHRGTGIEGGARHHLGAGDVIHIPAGVPHQLFLAKGKPFTYFVVKVAGQ